METIIQIQHLQKHFGNLKVLNDVDFDIHKGEVVTIIGSSGSGKSTLLRCINLLEIPDGGNILYKGTDILSGKLPLTTYRSKVGMVFQSFTCVVSKVHFVAFIGRHPIMGFCCQSVGDRLDLSGRHG